MNMESKLLKIVNAQLVIGDSIITNASLLIRDGIIEAIAEGNIKNNEAEEVNALGKYVAPGLIDVQINGYMGVDFSDQHLTLEDIRKAIKALWKAGVTTILPTVITNAQSNLNKSFSILSTSLDDEEIGVSIPGFHLEGPYISPVQGYRGAHLEKYISKPDWDEFQTLQKSANSGIRLITVAPEIDGAIPFIKKCTEAGIVVALGHHNASSQIIKQAADAGVTMVTHLGNGCANTVDRYNNPFWPQLADDRFIITVIADGFHVNQDQLQCFYKMKGLEKTILVSDALDLAGLPPGEYTRVERLVVLTPDVVKFPAENVLAGAAIPLSTCVTKMMQFTNCSLCDAFQMASTNPAETLGLNTIGEIKIGKRADLIFFEIENNKLLIKKTFVAGKEVYSVN
jgi:N-acetylglucosamine-6-phosphate deacetylase